MYLLHYKHLGLIALGIGGMSACAYQPSSHFIGNLFDKDVYVEVAVDTVEPENAPFIKDAMHRIVYQHFQGHIVPKARAKSQIYITYSGTYFQPISYKNGYVTRYRAYTHLYFRMLTKQGEIKKQINAMAESDIQESALHASTLRTEAIKKGLEKGLDSFLAYVSAYSVTKPSKVP